MLSEYKQNLIPPEIIDLIMMEDEKALSEFFKHYENTIKTYCKKIYYDSNGNRHFYLNEDKEQKLKEHLVTAVKRYRF